MNCRSFAGSTLSKTRVNNVLFSLAEDSNIRLMRDQLKKFQKHNSTKYERRFMELLKQNHIKFRGKKLIRDREVDFVIGKYAIEINGHEQDTDKNEMLVECGYVPVHYHNSDINLALNLDYLIC